MNALDIILIVLLAWSAFKGWRTGLLQSLLSLVGLVVAYVLALAYGQSVGESLIGEGDLYGILGILGVFFATILAVHISARFIRAFLHATPFGIIDEIAGGVLGLAQGTLAFGLLVVLAYSYPLHSKITEQIEGSTLAGPVQTGALTLVDGIKVLLPSVKEALSELDIRGADNPPDVVETLKSGADEARQKLDGIVEESKKRLEDGASGARNKVDQAVKDSKKQLQDGK